MKNRIMKFCFIAFAAFCTMSLVTSCSDSEGDAVSVENFVGEAEFALGAEGKIGRRGCYEFVFPITIDFPDETSATVDSYENLRETLRAWKEDNPDADERPMLAYPIELMTEEGDLISVADRSELRDLRRACRRAHFDGRWRPGKFFRGACFKPVLPVTIEFPDGSTVEVASRSELKDALRTWKQENPDAEERPQVQYPITVEYDDGTQVEVGSKEELVELKEDCDQDS